MKARELAKEVERAGAVLVRTNGDHHMYRFSTGERLAIPFGGRQSEVSKSLYFKAMRMLKNVGPMPVKYAR